MKKRLLSLTLSILMILALIPSAVFAADNEASIGEVGYATLADAITAAEDGETIKILKDVNLGEQIIVEKSITIDLGGNTITATADDGLFRFNNGSDGFALKNGTIESGRGEYITNELIIVYDAGGTFEDLTIDSTNYQYGVAATTDGDEDVMLVDCEYAIECKNVKVTGPANLFYTDYIPMTLTDCEATQAGSAVKDWHNCAISASWGATVTVESGTYSGKYVLNENSSPAKIVVNGGEFTGEIKDWGLGASYTAYGSHEWEISGGYFTVDPADYLADGYESITSDKSGYDYKVGIESTITFVTNGGGTIDAITGEYDTDITMPDDPEKTGYTFAGWFTNEALTAEFADTKFGKEDVTLYAKWTANTITITFECNGGTPVDPICGDYGTDITMPEAPAKEGFEFVGWFTDSTFAGEAFAETTFSADVTLYAKWEAAAGTEVVTETIEGETAVNADNLTIAGTATEEEIIASAATVSTDVVATDSLKAAADAILAEATETEAKVEEIKTMLEDAGIDTTVTAEDGVTTEAAIIVVYAVAGVSVEPISYEETSADEVTTTYEITPTVTLVASTAQNASEIVMEGAGVNAVEIAAAQPVEVTDTVTISVKLPAMFASKTVYVSHKGSVVAAEANAEGDITFDAEGMSPFTFSLTDPTAAKIGSANYETLEAAIAAADAGEVIVLTKDCSESDLTVPNMDLTISCGAFTLDASALTSEATMTVNGENGVDQEIVFVYKETPVGNPSSGRPSSGKPAVQPVEPAPVEPVESAPAAKKFKDIPETAYYAKAVDWAVENEITSGTSETTFSPNAECTRAQIMTFLWIANGKADAAATNKFADVSASSYYAKAVAWAVENGITSGLNATTFGSEASCTRAQVMTFMWIAAGKPEPKSPAKFGDVPTDTYYAKAVAWAVEQGITSGTGLGTFSPEAVCTRAQIVTFLYGVYGM